MSADIKQKIDTNSTEFNEGVEAGLNSVADTKNWQAGNALGQALKAKSAPTELIAENPVNEIAAPLFMSDSPEGQKGTAQDEKDATGE